MLKSLLIEKKTKNNPFVPLVTSGGLSHAWRWDRCMCWDPQLCCQVSSEQTGPLNSGTQPLVQVPFEGKLRKSHPLSHLLIIQTRWKKLKKKQAQKASKSGSEIVTFTWFSLHASRLCLGKFQGGDPALAFHLAAGLQMVRLRSAIRDDKVAGVVYGDGCCGQVDCATTCVTHLSLGSDHQEFEWKQTRHKTENPSAFRHVFVRKCTCSMRAAHCSGQTTSADIL